jgi:hypothetical protein
VRHPRVAAAVAILVTAGVAGCRGTVPSPTAGAATGTQPPAAPPITASAGPSGSSGSSSPLGSGGSGGSGASLGRLVAGLAPVHLPAPLTRASAAVVGTSIIIAGGIAGSGTTARILRYTPSDGAITAIGSLREAVHDAAAALAGGTMLVLGGGATVAGSAVQAIGPSGAGSLIGQLPAPRADLGAATVAAEAIAAGGWTGSALDRRVLATTDGRTFRVVATLPIGVRYPAVAALDGLVYVIGGAGSKGDIAAIQVVDPAAGSARIAGQLPYPLAEATAVVVGGRLLVAGGRRGSTASDAILEVVPSSFAVRGVGTLPGPRADAAGAVVGTVAYLVGGEDAGPLDTIVELAYR